ncbi:CATRA system-associated protein [Streptomyces sp. NPDC052687]|uniref:CATRA system-associated protein n=1 Tax=Streptomyces sp. NPDC052687 TaxID=3154759 RepID=UPI003441534D
MTTPDEADSAHLAAALPPNTARLLSDVRAWRLTEEGWSKVREALRLLAAAIDQSRPDQARRAVTMIKICGPVRVVRDANPAMAEPPPVGGLPQDVGELVNHVVHTLGLPQTPPPDGDGSGADTATGGPGGSGPTS